MIYSVDSFSGLEYYFYSPLGQKSSEEFLLRVKRDGDAKTNELTQKTENSPDSVATVTAKTLKTANLTSVDAVSKTNTNITSIPKTDETKPEVDETKLPVKDNSKSRGFILPANLTTTLKELDVNDKVINATIDTHLSAGDLDNITNATNDHHKYYNSSQYDFSKSWIDLNEWNKTKKK